MITQT